MSYSTRWLFGLLTVGAVSTAAILSPNSYWAPVLTTLSLVVQLAAVINWIYGKGESRAFAVGFAICNGFFLLIEHIPAIGRPLVHNLLPWAMWGTDSNLRLGAQSPERAHVGCIISGFLLGYAGAVLAGYLYRKNWVDSQSQP